MVRMPTSGFQAGGIDRRIRERDGSRRATHAEADAMALLMDIGVTAAKVVEAQDMEAPYAKAADDNSHSQ